jgi:hypothetical protein
MIQKTDNLSVWLLRATSTLLSVAIMYKIISLMPEDDNNLAEGYAVVFILFVWSGLWLVCAFVGWLVSKVNSRCPGILLAALWCVFAAIGFYGFAVEFSLDSSPNLIFWLEFVVICTIPAVLGWAWSKTLKISKSKTPNMGGPQ